MLLILLLLLLQIKLLLKVIATRINSNDNSVKLSNILVQIILICSLYATIRIHLFEVGDKHLWGRLPCVLLFEEKIFLMVLGRYNVMSRWYDLDIYASMY